MENNVVDEQGNALLSKINHISTAITEILNQRFNLRSKFEIEFQAQPSQSYKVDSNISNSQEEICSEFSELTTIVPTPPATSKDNCAIRYENGGSDPTSKRRKSSRVKFSKRLPPETISVLDEWYVVHIHILIIMYIQNHILTQIHRYNENISNPYLSKEDLKELVLKTKLQEIQIKNWASNRRRKRKDYDISDVYAEILNSESIK